GSTKVTAALGGKSASADVAVTVPGAARVAVSATATGPLTSLGDARQLTAVASDARGQAIREAAIAWSSSAPGVARVDGAGLVTAVANGNAVITARAGTASADLTVAVAQAAASVAVTPASVTLPPDGVQAFAAQALDARGHPVAGAAAAA